MTRLIYRIDNKMYLDRSALLMMAKAADFRCEEICPVLNIGSTVKQPSLVEI